MHQNGYKSMIIDKETDKDSDIAWALGPELSHHFFVL